MSRSGAATGSDHAFSDITKTHGIATDTILNARVNFKSTLLDSIKTMTECQYIIHSFREDTQISLHNTFTKSALFAIFRFNCVVLTLASSEPPVEASDKVPKTDTIVDAVRVDKQPVSVVTKLWTRRSPRALTKWFFHCKNQFWCDSKVLESSENVLVQLKITKVKITISLPIETFLPANASDDLKRHESGHVSICTQVYKNAENAAGKSARSVVGKTFLGEGTDFADARQDALNNAAKSLCSSYRSSTAEVVDRVSMIYDGLTRHHAKITPELALKKSFATYARLEQENQRQK